MCGIIGRVGKEDCVNFLLDSLEFLEYRGYDSAGIALGGAEITRCREVGRLLGLKEKVKAQQLCGNVGIGHTRWATHGEPTAQNAHPHMSHDRRFAVVHNGIIENADELFAAELADIKRVSQTDTEVVPLLLEKYYNGDITETLSRVLGMLKGSYALGILCSEHPDKLFAAASASPLAVAYDGGVGYIASDAGTLKDKCKTAYSLKNGEFCVLSTEGVHFFDRDGESIKKEAADIESDPFIHDKQGFEHYMMLEIQQQDRAVKDTLAQFIRNDGICLDSLDLPHNFIEKDIRQIVISACGSAYHAATVGKYLFETLCAIPCRVEIASELRYSEPLIDDNTLAVFISQSGETADTLASLRLAKRKGAKVLSIVNVAGSAMAQESDNVIYTRAGREVAVATTKAYSAQLSALYALAVCFAVKRGRITAEREGQLIEELLRLPQKIRETLDATEETARRLSKVTAEASDIYFIGRRLDLATALEGSLKMKEISYIHSEAYAAGELKHGTIALIENGTPVIAIAGDESVFSKTYSNICEVKARGAEVITVTTEKNRKTAESIGECIVVPNTALEFAVSLQIIPLQLLSYYTAQRLGCDIDKPKNLAKSVTVE